MWPCPHCTSRRGSQTLYQHHQKFGEPPVYRMFMSRGGRKRMVRTSLPHQNRWKWTNQPTYATSLYQTMIQNDHTGTSGKKWTGATFRRQTLIRLTEKSIAEFALELLENLESELEHWTAGIKFHESNWFRTNIWVRRISSGEEF